MAADCLAQPRLSGACLVVSPLGQPDAITITASVGAGGANISTDVRTIQAALNDVPSESGGPDPALAVDGVVGPLTLAAIKGFQQTHVSIVDSRIDPDGPTLAALNAEPGGNVPIAAQGLAAAAPRRQRRSDFLPPDPAIIPKVLELLERVRGLIRAANFRLTLAGPFITTRKLTVPSGPFLSGARDSLDMLDKVFSLGKFSNPRPSFDNISRVFRNMDVALNRTFETARLIAPVLFVPNTHISMEPIAAAYTSVGGAFRGPKEKFSTLPELANRIYVCQNFLDEVVVDQVEAMVHELAHFVSGQPISITDIVKRGRMRDPAFRDSFDAIKPAEKIKSAEHYAFFALVAKFRNFL